MGEEREGWTRKQRGRAHAAMCDQAASGDAHSTEARPRAPGRPGGWDVQAGRAHMRSQPIHLTHGRDKQHRMHCPPTKNRHKITVWHHVLSIKWLFHGREDHACLVHSRDHPTPALQPINPPLSASPLDTLISAAPLTVPQGRDRLPHFQVSLSSMLPESPLLLSPNSHSDQQEVTAFFP